MSFPEDEQQPSPAAEPAHEPRLLTRPDRDQTPPKPAATRQRPPVREPEQVPLRRPRPKAAKSKAERKKHRRRVRLILRVAAGSGALLCVVALVALLYFRHVVGSSLPVLDGSVRAQGLHAPVTVTRDEHGVPSITASSLHDLLFAQGYTTASDRLWQMDALRRHAAGELAEILGPAMAEHDRRQRFLQIRAAADRAVAQLPADQLAQLEAYAQGVNSYIDTHTGSLPLEFRMLAYQPARWTPRDSLLVSLAMWQDLSTSFPREMDREALSAHLPADLVSDLYPVGSWRDKPPVDQTHDITAPHIVEQIPLDPSQSRLRPAPATGPAPQVLLAVSTALAGTGRCDGCRSGSNNWAVSGTRTASGAPLISNDMHLSLSIPDIWYEASLHADISAADPGAQRIDVTGFTLPGVPFVIVGRNSRVAWGVTNLGADVQDLRIEHLRGEGANTEFERPDGTWAAVKHHEEVVRVRGGRNLTLDVMTTTHPIGDVQTETPLISSLYRGETRALSLAWTVYDPAAANSPFLGVNTAHDGASLVSAFAHFGGPALNLVWADADGHIGYHALGMIPVRGPATQHPRPTQAPIVEQGPPPPDEGTDEPGPEALLATQPHIVLSAFHPGLQRHRAVARRPVQRTRRAAPARPAPQRRRVESARPQPAPQPQEAELPPAPPPLEYTLGSAISPLPVDALDANQAWSEYVPFDALPTVLDPKNGYVATANARVTGDDYPYALAVDWADPFRVERIVHMLEGRKGLTPDDMLRMQTDVYSDVDLALAQRLAYAIDHASAKAMGGDVTRLRAAANLLRAWDGQMRTDSAAAAIVTTAREALWPALLVPQIAAHDGISPEQASRLAMLYTWSERSTALELLILHRPARWLPKGFANWSDFLASTLGSGLREAHAPGNLAHWQYGQLHRVEISHPIYGAHPLISRLVGVRPGTGEQPAPGDATTVDAIGAHFGPSERFTADLSSPDAALGNITTGQSGNPRSPWYLDQFRTWLNGETFSLPNSRTAAAHTLTLTP